MLRLYLYRHAKAASAEAGGDDFDRPLTERGRSDAGAMATFLDVKLTRRLYEASAEDLLDGLRGTGGTANAILMVGHNPGLEELAAVLAPEGDADALAAMHEKFPTAALAAITFDAPRWNEIGPGAGRLVAFHTPQSIGKRN